MLADRMIEGINMTIRSTFAVICMFWCLLLPVTLRANAPLPLEQAFRLQAVLTDQQVVSLQWQIAPGYYLYAEKFHFTTEPPVAITANIPQGEFKYDPENGKQEVVKGYVVIPVTLKPMLPVTLTVHYQGCSQDGFCYPPTDKKYQVDVAAHKITEMKKPAKEEWRHLLFDHEKIKELLSEQQQGFTLLLFFAFGLLLAFTPCVLPMLPILSSIIMGDVGKRHPSLALSLSFFYVLGSAFTYALIGLLAASAGQSLQVILQQPIVIVLVTLLFLLLAAINFGWVAIIFPRIWQQAVHAINHRITGGSYISVFFMGVISTCIVSPCITAPLLGVLLYIAQTGDKMLGMLALFSMGLGLGVPLLLVGSSLNYLLPRSGAWLLAIKHGFGFIMLGMAIWLLARILPATIIYALSGVLLLIIASYIAFWLPNYLNRRKFCLVLGVLIGLFGFYAMSQYASSWLQQDMSVATESSFLRVSTLSELDAVLLAARQQNKPVLVDFYADWCASCVTMEKNVLSTKQVVAMLKQFQLVRVDLTHYTAEDQAIMRRFNVLAPPTFLLFDRTGNELTNKRIIGEVDEPFFLTRLQAVK